jgi:hypothetical protein
VNLLIQKDRIQSRVKIYAKEGEILRNVLQNRMILSKKRKKVEVRKSQTNPDGIAFPHFI